MPKNDPNDLLRIINPTEEDFTVAWGGINHTIRAGERKIVQRYLAHHIAKHLTDREILRKTSDHKHINNPVLRKEWADKIVIGVENYFQGEQPMTEGDRTKREVEMTNATVNDKLRELELRQQALEEASKPSKEVDESIPRSTDPAI